MERFDINVNLKQAEAIEFLLGFVCEDNGIAEFLEIHEMNSTDFDELHGAVRRAVLNLEFSKAVDGGNRCDKKSEERVSVIETGIDLNLLK